jgi:hypothetical protein
VERLDEERIELLRRWGEGLAEDGREQVRAAGRAILILIDEIDRLHADLTQERAAGQAATPAEGPASTVEPDLEASLRSRLAQLHRRRTPRLPGGEPG